MGRPRFAELMELLPPDLTVMGIDEKTALTLDVQAGEVRVGGLGGVTLIHTGHRHHLPGPDLHGSGLAEVAEQRRGHVHTYRSGETFPLSECCPFQVPLAGEGLPEEVWAQALEAQARLEAGEQAEPELPSPPQEVLDLVERRQAARQRKDWAASDALREQIAVLGWQVLDTPQGPQLIQG